MSVYFKETVENLRTSIQSMLNQSILPAEFVLVKDGPLPDLLNEEIRRFCSQYPDLFKIVALEKNSGLGAALTVGLESCNNELIARMDSDDYSTQDRCELELAEFIKDPSLDVVGCVGVEFEGEISNQISVHKVPQTPNEIADFMHYRCAVIHPTVIYKKSVVIRCGGYQSIPLYEDYDLFIRMMKNGVQAFNVQKPLYYIRVSKDFFARRGGLYYMRTTYKFKRSQFLEGYLSFTQYLVSAWGQVLVCLFPNRLRTLFYKTFLR